MIDKAAIARDLRAQGLSYNEIGREIGCGGSRVYRMLNPEADQRNRANEAARRAKPRPDVKAEPVDWKAKLREIPEDTRSLTALLCGDPLPNDPRRQA